MAAAAKQARLQLHFAPKNIEIGPIAVENEAIEVAWEVSKTGISFNSAWYQRAGWLVWEQNPAKFKELGISIRTSWRVRGAGINTTFTIELQGRDKVTCSLPDVDCTLCNP